MLVCTNQRAHYAHVRYKGAKNVCLVERNRGNKKILFKKLKQQLLATIPILFIL